MPTPVGDFGARALFTFCWRQVGPGGVTIINRDVAVTATPPPPIAGRGHAAGYVVG